MNLNVDLPKWLAVPLRLLLYVIVIFVLFKIVQLFVMGRVAANIAQCSTSPRFQAEMEALARTKDMMACIEHQNGWLENLAIKPLRDAINAMPSNPGQFVGGWRSEQPNCEYQFELKASGEFKAEPVACAISSETYTGIWGVHDDQMLWLYDSRGPWRPDINKLDVVDEDFFLLTELDGSRTRFRRVGVSTTASAGTGGTTQQSQLTTDVPDVPEEDVGALVRMQEQTPDSQTPPQQPKAVVDERGWIDIWALQRDVVEVERLPRENSDWCSTEVEGGEDDVLQDEIADVQAPQSEEERKAEAARMAEQVRMDEEARKAEEVCYADVAKMESAYEQAFKAFNAEWLEPLKLAVAKGDPVAEVVLRVCSTTDAIDRRGIDTDCSSDQSAAQRAWQRLEGIGFAPALTRLTHEDLHRMTFTRQLPPPMRQWRGQGPYSDEPYIAMLERQLDTLQNGDLSAGENTGGYHCGQERGRLARGTEGYERCNHLYHMAMAMKGKARWFFMAGDLYDTEYRGSLGLKQLRLYRKTANPPQPFRTHSEDKYPAGVSGFGIDDTASFEAELRKRLRILDATVASYLRQDPRWAVFLMHREGDKLLFGAPPEPVPK